MPNLRCEISFPGAASIQSATYTLQHGISPGLITIVCNPGLGGLAPTGPVTFGDGQRSMTIPNCRVEAGEFKADTGGQTITVRLFDRRWMWRYGVIFGHWNVPCPRLADVPKINESGTQTGNQANVAPDEDLPPIQQGTKKSARRLCELCLEAMGEKRYDIRNIPENDYPEVNWDAANPAQELQSLAERYGCRVVYNPIRDNVTLAVLGVGIPMPDAPPGFIASDGITVDPPEPPGRIVVYGAPIRYQVRFTLEAVGLDFDGRVKLLDDLSYKPAGGWRSKSPPFLVDAWDFAAALPGSRTEIDADPLANESVYKWFRIKETLPIQKTGEFWVPVESRDYIDKINRNGIVLLESRVETSEDDLGERLMISATCYGETFDGSLTYGTTLPGQEVRTPFSIDSARQIIKFVEPQYLDYKEGGRSFVRPANLILETACHVTERRTNSIRRFRYEFNVGGPRKGTRPPHDEYVVVREDIQNYVKVNYVDAIDNRVNTTVSNKPACDKQALYYAQAELAKFQTKAAQTRAFNAVMPVICDGAIQSVMWSVSLGGITTQVSRDGELAAVALPYNVRRRQEQENLRRLYEDRGYTRPAVQKRIAAARDFLGGGS